MTHIDIRKFETQDRDWIVAAHMQLYAQEYGFDDSFGIAVSQIVDAFIANDDEAREQGWIAWQGAVRLGSIFCMQQDAQLAKLRLFQIAPPARGQGLGLRLLKTCTQYARSRGYSSMTLGTHKSHAAACALYLRNGWQITEEKPVKNYGQTLIEQTMILTL